MLCRIRRIALVVSAVAVVALSAGCFNRHVQSAQTNLTMVVATNWTAYQQAHGVPGGGVAIYLLTPTGEYFAASGMAGDVDQNAHFRIASNTKTFTSAAIMLLNQQGKLNIDDAIVSLIPGTAAPYIPDAPAYDIPYKAEITIRELLSHTAGVFDVDNSAIPASCEAPYAGQNYPLWVEASDPEHPFTADELVGVDTQCQLSYFAPGADYHYSDTGYMMLALIIERVSGLPYDRFLMENLIGPNGLSSTSVVMSPTDRSLPPPFAVGYEYAGGALMDVTADNMSLHVGEGNITSTPADLARWVRRLVRGEAGPNAATVAEMMTPTPQSLRHHGRYGLGISSISDLGDGHTGANQGYLSLMMYDPRRDVALIEYFNVWDDANLMTAQWSLMLKIAREASAAVGY